VDGKGVASSDLKRVAKEIAYKTQWNHMEQSERSRAKKIADKLLAIGKDIYADFVWQITETKEFAELCKAEGLDSVIAWEEHRDFHEPNGRMVKTYGVFSSNQVKSADLVTYDDNGNIIPLSERFNDEKSDIRWSRSEDAPTFYSHMSNTIDGMKDGKHGANSVIPYLKGKGVKDEEIKWSGIETFLEGKKSVTKAELQEFAQGSQLQIKEEITFGKKTKWSRYKLQAGKNYREITFSMPDSTYTNDAMKTHWGENAEGILAHARVQDFDVDGKKMLFIEEIQSDWHNEGHKKGYSDSNSVEGIEDAPFRDNYHEYVLKRLIRMAAGQGYDSIGWTTADIQSKRWSDEFAEGYRIEYDQDIPKFLNKYGKKWGARVSKSEINGVIDEVYFTTDEGEKHTSYVNALNAVVQSANELAGDGDFSVSDVYTRENEGVTIVLDKVTDIELGTITKVSKDTTTVWSMPITDAMKESVLGVGQPLYSRSEPEKTFAKGEADFSETRAKANAVLDIEKQIKALSDKMTEENRKEIFPEIYKLYEELDKADKALEKAIANRAETIKKAKASKAPAAPERWQTEKANRTKGKDFKVKGVSDIVSKLEHDFGIPISSGHISERNARGIYKVESEAVRTKDLNNLPTALHEVGHHLTRKFNLTDVSKNIENELLANADASFLDQYKDSEKPGEAVAEFFRNYFQNAEKAEKSYPLFTKYLFSKLDKKTADIVNENADIINNYYVEASKTATSAIKLAEEKSTDFRTVGERFSDKTNLLYQSWYDSNHAIKLFTDEVQNRTAYTFATNAAYADSRAYSMVVGDLYSIDGVKVGEGLAKALENINTKKVEEYKEFGEYLICKNGIERLAEGLDVWANEIQNTEEWMSARIKELEAKYPTFMESSERLYAFQKSFLNEWGVKSGLVSEESAKSWAERWQYYVPFTRKMETVSKFSKKRNQADSTIKKAKGSKRDFQHPIDSIMFNMQKMVSAALTNRVRTEISNQAEIVPGTGYIIEKIPTPMVADNFNVSELVDELNDAFMSNFESEEDIERGYNILLSTFGEDGKITKYQRGKANGDIIT
ncbi:MAG: hypothetical protein U0L88_13625, partial [Acutalibacteraceae bacterium]|nr:hypothetical protein [Acutalibacteraceae bacterium]